MVLEVDHNSRVGYGGQWVIDAANTAPGMDRLALRSWSATRGSEKKAFVQLALYLRLNDGSWFTKDPGPKAAAKTLIWLLP